MRQLAPVYPINVQFWIFDRKISLSDFYVEKSSKRVTVFLKKLKNILNKSIKKSKKMENVLKKRYGPLKFEN